MQGSGSWGRGDTWQRQCQCVHSLRLVIKTIDLHGYLAQSTFHAVHMSLFNEYIGRSSEAEILGGHFSLGIKPHPQEERARWQAVILGPASEFEIIKHE